MDSKDLVKNDSVDLRLMSPAELSILHPGIVREARTVRAAAIRKALRPLASGIFRAFGAARAAQQRRRLEREAVAELRAFSDYALRDLGIARSEIRQRVHLPEKPAAVVRNRASNTVAS
jgi:uncharacterized protein YjiS (DUF1127 family)